MSARDRNGTPPVLHGTRVSKMECQQLTKCTRANWECGGITGSVEAFSSLLALLVGSRCGYYVKLWAVGGLGTTIIGSLSGPPHAVSRWRTMLCLTHGIVVLDWAGVLDTSRRSCRSEHGFVSLPGEGARRRSPS